jgi:hypothetical protein
MPDDQGHAQGIRGHGQRFPTRSFLSNIICMARISNGLRHPTTLFEAAAWHRSIVATCQHCGHEAVFDPHQLWWLFERKAWEDQLGSLPRRLRCTRCNGRRPVVQAGERREASIHLPWPDERVWKQALSRWRS